MIITEEQPLRRGWLVRHARALVVSIGFVLAVLALAVGAVGWVGSERAIHPKREIAEHSLSEYPFAKITEAVRFQSLDGTSLAGWFIPGGRTAAPTVILLHGYRQSRAELLPHVGYLHSAGFNVLLFDFRDTR